MDDADKIKKDMTDLYQQIKVAQLHNRDIFELQDSEIALVISALEIALEL